MPAVLYGPKLESLPLELDLKTFEKAYREAGESSLISLEVGDGGKKYLVLIHEVERDSLTGALTHISFYQPNLEKEIEAKIPIIFEGEAPAVKDLGGTLIKNFPELEVKALPQNLLKEIKIEVSQLKTFEDHILIKDIKLPDGVKILKDPDEIVAQVVPPEKVEEELMKPIEEKVEEVEKVKEKKEEEVPEAGESAEK